MNTAAAEEDALGLVGSVVAEKYRVVGVVGHGGFATVYRADHLLWQRPVALKVFRSFPRLTAEQRAMLFDGFLREGRVLSELSERSATIVQSRDTGMLVTASGATFPFMVLEWLEGETLEARLQKERDQRAPLRTVSEAVALLHPIADALGLAHARGIAHRDVKPANIFLLNDGQREASLKLLDFGIAKVATEAQAGCRVFVETRKAAGDCSSDPSGEVTTFTPGYGAPEQFSRRYGVTGPWTDVFALALTFVELVAGREALLGDTLSALGAAACDPTKRPTPRALGVVVGDGVERVLTRALAVLPADRYPDARRFWSELEVAGEEDARRRSSTHPSSARPTDPLLLAHEVSKVTSPRQPRRLAMVAAAAALLGASLAPLFLHEARRPAASPPPPASATPAPPATASASKEICPPGMATIPGGHFFMGSDDKDDLPVERPSHGVQLGPYCIDLYEVTTADYKAASDIGTTKRAGRANAWEGITSDDHEAFDPLCNVSDPEGRATHPINCVTWEMAKLYCESVHKRLPTEAEWEFAARGPDGRKYPWGDAPPGPGLLNACGKECVLWGRSHHVTETAMYGADDGWPTTAPVGSFPEGRSRYGLYDVAGNVWEWVADRYAPYTPEESKSPTGPSVGDERVIRGGAWNGAYDSWVRPTVRFHDKESTRSYGIGFRCAASLP